MPTPMTSAGSTPALARTSGIGRLEDPQVVVGILERPVGRQDDVAVRERQPLVDDAVAIRLDGGRETGAVGDVDEDGAAGLGPEVDADRVPAHRRSPRLVGGVPAAWWPRSAGTHLWTDPRSVIVPANVHDTRYPTSQARREASPAATRRGPRPVQDHETGSRSTRSPACAGSPRRRSRGSSTSARTCRPETRAAVEAAIAATGFQPSAVARSLVQRRSQTLGVIVAGPALLRCRPDAQRDHRGVPGGGLRPPAQGDREHRHRATSRRSSSS